MSFLEPPDATRYCRSCGSPVAPDADRCPACGVLWRLITVPEDVRWMGRRMPNAIKTGRQALLRERAVLERHLRELHVYGDEVDRLISVINELDRRLPRGPEALLSGSGRPPVRRVPRGALRGGILKILARRRALHVTGILDALARVDVVPA